MARQTRAQRRARREARQEDGLAPVRRADGGGNGPERRPAPEAPRVTASQRGSKLRLSFVRESWGELQKVEWPTQNQLVQGVVVVLVACVIVGVYLWVADLAFKRLVQHVFI